MSDTVRTITLREYETTTCSRSMLSRDDALVLRQKHSNHISIQQDWLAPDNWSLTSLGYVGCIPLGDRLHLDLEPKVSIGHLFQMLEYAYSVGEFGQGEMQVETLRELYERLALVLARRVLDRTRKGLYRSYVRKNERLATVRGRLDIGQVVRSPWQPRLPCYYEEHTADIEENQILTWTLSVIARSAFCGDRARPTVRQAYRQLCHVTTVQRMEPGCCINRLYNRLNEDYGSLHALCRFFLESCGPTRQRGNYTMLPFTISMAQLFESFVAAWLQTHAHGDVRFRAHHNITWDEVNGLRSDIDLMMVNTNTGKTLSVLDTKYKSGDTLSESDIHQIVFYAEIMGCAEAVLIYPTNSYVTVDEMVGAIHVRTLGFDLSSDLDRAGKALLDKLLERNRPDVSDVILR